MLQSRGYMPPEYLRGIITPMFDIFSLGVIIMEVITGHREYPYDIRTSSEFVELVRNIFYYFQD
jgi:serine/threonine protein kinase